MTRNQIGAGCAGILWAVVAAAQSPAPAPDAAKVAQKIQAFYQSTTDYQASFTQTYTSKAFGRAKVSKGFLYIKKPGRMRMDYREPRTRFFLVDGKSAYSFDEELEQVQVVRNFTQNRLTTALSFLWGEGDLARDFQASLPTESPLGVRHDLVLLLQPKDRAEFNRLYFVVDPKSFMVKETLVEDVGGNLNHLVFSEVSVNVGLGDDSFRFVPPAGAEIVEVGAGEIQ